MEFSYYDLLSRIIVGYFTLIASFYAFGINYNETINHKKKYTGIGKVRLYDTEQIIKKLKKETNSKAPTTRELFSIAKRKCNGNKDCRIPIFSAQYAFSRVLLTSFTIVTCFMLSTHYYDWRYYLLFIPLFVFWNRFRERGYYYAREVLNEYMKHN